MPLSGRNSRRELRVDTSAFFSDDGTGDGNIHMNVDGSVTPVDFFVVCPPGKTMEFSAFTIAIIDGGMYANKFGGIPELANGMVGFVDLAIYGGYRVYFFDKQPIKTNAAFLSYGDYQYMSFGSGDEGLRMTYTMTPGVFPIHPGDKAGIIVRDDLRELTDHTIRATMTSYDYPEVI